MNFNCIDATLNSLLKLEIMLVNGILGFYALVVHEQSIDSLASGREYSHLAFSL